MSEDPSTLNGNCHCGRFRFELTGADLTQAIKCDCDHCRKAGCLWLGLSSPKIRFHPTRNGDHLIHYTSERFKKQARLEDFITLMLSCKADPYSCAVLQRLRYDHYWRTCR